MIDTHLIKEVKNFVYSQKYPSRFHIDLSKQKGQQLAKGLGANGKIVLLGTLLMDCMLSKAISEGKLSKHIGMSERKANQLLSKYSDISEGEKENILCCIREHHGVKKFSSLEAEICCNADFYRFASIAGVIGGIKSIGEIGVEEIVELYKNKLDEKWGALSIGVCKIELKPQYRAIKNFLENFRK